MTARIDAAALVKAARATAGLSQRELAQRAGTSQSVVARIELGETSPTVRTLNRLLEARASPRGGDQLAERLGAYFASSAVPGTVSAYLFGSASRNTGHAESRSSPRSCVFGSRPTRSSPYAMMSWIASPATSVSRKSRPL